MADYEKRNDVSLDWDDIIDDDGQEFITLPEGDYDFTVVSAERAVFNGSAKMKPGKKSIVTLQVVTEDGIANVRLDFVLNEMTMWRISAFFRSIGLKKRGEPFKMDWPASVNKTGRAHFKPRPFTDKNGNEREANDVAYFYDPAPDEPKKQNLASPLDDGDLPFD